MINILITIVLIVLSLIFAAVIGMLFEGIDRKVKAKLQGRVGPPLLQSFIDQIKLINKESIIPRKAARNLFILAPYASLGFVSLAVLLLPIGALVPALRLTGDFIVVLYLLTAASAFLMLAGSASASHFGAIGSSREMTQIYSYELPLIIPFSVVFLLTETFSFETILGHQTAHGWLITTLPFAGIAFLLCMIAKLGKPPFDSPEADVEIIEGSLAEYSGNLLSVFKLANAIKLFAAVSLFVIIFLGGPVGPIPYFAPGTGILNHLIKMLVVIAFISVFANINPRFKIKSTFGFFWGIVFALTLIDLIRMILEWV
ncbi:MAG: complex I subunit 1 family protein [Methanobacterium sp.]|jgi:NADH-quinone oxidoreductase subunit H